MDEKILAKYRHLVDILSSRQSIGVAYSGGVDSTLVSWAACEAVRADRVVLLHAASPLLPEAVTRSAEAIIKKQFSKDVGFKIIEVNPLLEQTFIVNDANRCYVCKKMIYTQLLQECAAQGIETLLDGTNCDDLEEDRPGHRAIEELFIQTPLVQAGFTKIEIREMAAALGLENAELPSNSCLATRLERDATIAEELLIKVDEMECYLHRHAFTGCRVKPRGEQVTLELRETDISRLLDRDQRNDIVEYFRSKGYTLVLLSLKGR